MAGRLRRPDTGNPGGMNRPGADTRVWITWAVVTDVGFDSREGVFVDIQCQPDGQEETCYLGQPYAGNGFGVHFPLEVNDTVLVAIPLGDPGFGPTIISRAHNAGDPPAADFGDGEEPVSDVVLRVKPGQKLKIRTSDSGDGVDIQVAGDGDMVLKTASGTIKMQDASQSFVRGDEQRQAFEDFLTALVVWAEVVKVGINSAPTVIDNTPFLNAIAELNSDLAKALSSKIKGE